MKKLVPCILIAILGVAHMASPQSATASDAQIPISDEDFQCISDMTPVRQFFITNLLGDLDATLEVANSPNGGKYPAGTLVQLVPHEAMVKHKPGWDAETNDWEFFFLEVTAGATKIVTRGHEEVVNGNGGNCFACHRKAEPQWDLICETDHGCDPVSLTQTEITKIQKDDPRCR